MRASIHMISSLLAILSVPSRAQWQEPEPVTKANWELARQWSPDRMSERARSQSLQPHWIDGGDAFWYRYLTAAGRFYWLVDPPRKLKEPLFDPDRMAAELTRLTGREHDAKDLDLDGFTFRDGHRLLEFESENIRYEYEREQQDLAAVGSVDAASGDDPEPWRNLSPDGRWCVYARTHDLYLCGATEPPAAATRLGDEGEYGLQWGSDWELIADTDTAPRRIEVTWSADSRRFCLLRVDMRRVPDLWLVDDLADPRPTLQTYKMPVPGGEVPQWQLWIGDCLERSMVRVDVDRWPDQTLEDLFGPTTFWAPDSEALFFVRRHRDYMQVDLCAADPVTGLVRTLIEERQPGMVYVRAPTLLPQSKELLWWSMRDGWGHLYRYGVDGTLGKQITLGEWSVDEVLAVDEGPRTVWFTGLGREGGRNPYYRHLYRVDLDDGEPQLLTPEDANHSCEFSPSRGYFLDSYSRPDEATHNVLRDAGGGLVLDLETADLSLLSAAGWQPPQVFHVPGADGATEQWGVMWLPFDLDPARKYPVVTRVYPGRQGEFVPWTFGAVDIETALAQLGCIVVRFGNRGGTPERGRAYREYGRDEFRDYGLPDKKAVIENLAQLHPWIDLDRVGIYGGSSGGFMTVSAMLVHPDFFKVGVAMTAPNDPMLYYNHWVERYAGVQRIVGEDGEASWRAAADGNLELAGNLKGRLLMIYGEMDDNVHPLHLFRMADAFCKAGKQFDMFIVPGAGHDLGDWRYLYTKLFDYFAEHLIGDPRRSVDGLFVE